jgi:hypothetical protein
LGPEPPATTNVIGQMVEAMMTESVENGADPAGIAEQVVEAILADRFWILTHPDLRHAPVERMLRAEAQENPA